MKIRYEYIFTPEEIKELCAMLTCAYLEKGLDYKDQLITIVIDRLREEKEIEDG